MNALLNENTGKKKHYLKRAPFLKVISVCLVSTIKIRSEKDLPFVSE